MPASDFLSQLPSLEELLENPRIKTTIDRVNRSNAAAQVRTALSGLGAEVSRRAEELQSIAPGELLEKLVRRLSDPVKPTVSPAINATGDLLGGWMAPPLPAAAREAMLAASEGFRTEEGSAAAVATRLLPCDAAALFSSPVAALSVAMESLAGGGVAVVGRSEMRELAEGVRLDDLARRAGVTLREVGATDAATLADYEAALEGAKADNAARLLVLHRPGGGATPTAKELAMLAGRFEATCLIDCGPARLRNDTPAYGDPAPSVEELLGSGAGVVIVSTAGRIGGPLGGLLVGRGSVVEHVTASPVAHADAVDPLTDAALAATLALFDQPDSLRFTHPLHQLLDAPLENLRTRAERLAPQIAAGPGVAAASPSEIATGGREGWRVEVQPEGEPGDLLVAVTKRSPGLVLGQSEGRLTVDLRSVFAGQDRAIAAAFAPDESVAGEASQGQGGTAENEDG